MADIRDNSITWGGKNSALYGIIVRKNPPLTRATRKYTKVNVAGRNGDLYIFQNAWDNYTQTYELRVGDGSENSTPLAMAQVAQWLAMDELHTPTYTDYLNLEVNGYHQLVDTYEPDVIRLATLTEGYSTDNLRGFYGNVDVTFNFRPERFTKDAFTEIVITGASETIVNPASMPAKPNILVAPYAEDGIIVNDYEISFTYTDATRRIVIDTELQDCYFDDDLSNANSYVIMPDGFPILSTGSNTISLGTYITEVTIIPRWWNL